MSAKRLVKLARRIGTQGVVWALVMLIVTPPSVLAQMQMQGQGGTPVPMLGAGGTQGAGMTSGQVIVTNPTALLPLVPPQTPCPAPPVTIPPSEFLTQSLNEFWPTDPATLLPLSLEQRMRQERQEREEKRDQEQHEKDKQVREREIKEQHDLQSAGLSQTAPMQPMQGGAGATAPLGTLGSGIQMGATQSESRKLPPQEREGLQDFTIEQAFSRFSILQGIKSRLKQFGYDFFDAQASGFAPILDVPVGPDYVIGPQDSLAIHVWNVPDQSFNRSYIVPVEQDGMLVIPQVGAIPVGGLTFSQAERVIHARLSNLLKRFELHVSMARLRTIKVYVVGEVVRPGAYEVSSLATVSNAVYAACGPTRSGSLRQIRVVQRDKAAAELDFYEFLLAGDRSHDRRLQAGDVIIVPPLGSVAAISGAVKRAAIYELKPGTRLTDLLRLAGGITPVANRKHCNIFRIEPGRGRVLMDVDLAAAMNAQTAAQERPPNSDVDPVVQDGDYVRIASLPTQVGNVVSLVGAVKNPGPYQYRPGMRVHDLLTQDNLTVDSYVERAEIIRTDPATYQTKVIQFSPKAIFGGDQAENHVLQRLDQVVVVSQLRAPNLVFIDGEVKRPGYFTIEIGERLSSLLKRVGGFTSNAFPSGIVLVRESVKIKQKAELDRFVAAERQRLTAQSAGAAAGSAGLAGGAALTTYGNIAEQQVLALRLQQLESITARVELGRVVVRLESIEKLEGTEDDLRLEARDKVMIPTPPQTVSIIGSVKNPTTVLYRPGLRLDNYLELAGNPTEDANMSELYVMKANGTTDSGYVRIKDMQPGDTIVVPQKIETKTPAVALWGTVASIIGSMMLGVAAISIIGK